MSRPATAGAALASPVLAGWVGDLEAFSAEHWQTKPATFTPQHFTSPFDLDELDGAFDSGLLRAPYLEMVRSNKVVVPPAAYTTSRVINGQPHQGYAERSKVVALLRGGATLLLRCVDQWHPATAELVSRLSDELGRRIEAFFFVTPAGGQGLAVHRDDADVFVLQASGTKTWYVHDAPATADWSPGELPDDERSPRLLRTVLEPGGVLYVPRGFAHRAVGAAGLSAHLSLTIRDVSLDDLRTALEARMSEGLSLPELPLGEDAIRRACATLLGHYRACLEAISPDELRLAARTLHSRRPAEATPPETLAEAAHTWDGAQTRSPLGGLSSLGSGRRRRRSA